VVAIPDVNRIFDIMSTELLSPSQDFSSEAAENVQTAENLQQEIDCPRCSDIMTLSSDFDGLLYICQECQLSLVIK
jgi:cytochrome c-type biogenesis protein CcmH/NrfF